MTEEDLDKFRQFINSLYLNFQNTIIDLFEYLVVKYPVISKEDISVKQILKKIYKTKEVKPEAARKLLSNFNKILERFLINLLIENNDTLRESLLLKAMQQDKFIRKIYLTNKNRQKSLEAKKFINIHRDYPGLAEIDEEIFNFYRYQNDVMIVKVLERRTKSLNYEIAYKKLKHFYEFIICEVFLTKDVVIDRSYYADVMIFVEINFREIKEFHPYIYLYYNIIKFYGKYEFRYLVNIEKYFKDIRRKLTDEMENEFLDVIRSGYEKMRSKRIGDFHEVTKKLFVIYDRLYMNGGKEGDNSAGEMKLFSYEFIYVVNVGISLNKQEWAKLFIDKYGNKTNDKQSKDCYYFALVLYYFSKGDFENTIISANEVSRKVPNYFYSSTLNVLKSYYELDDEEGMSNAFENLKQYIKRNRSITDYDRKVLQNFKTVFSDLLKIRDVKNNKALSGKLITDLENKIKTTEGVLDSRMWFLKKLKKQS